MRTFWKSPYEEPRMSKGTLVGTPKNREAHEYSRNVPTGLLILRLYSYYILEVPCLGSPVQSF